MLTIEQAPRAIASAADSADRIDSSRQIGVAMRGREHRVTGDVVLRQRLLDEQQVEAVERGERGDVLVGQ